MKLVISIDEAVESLIEENISAPIIFHVEDVAKRIVDKPENYYATLMKMLKDWWNSLPNSKQYPFKVCRVFKNKKSGTRFLLELSYGSGSQWHIYGYQLICAKKIVKPRNNLTLGKGCNSGGEKK